MSPLIGMHLGDYALIGSDTRVVRWQGDRIHSCDDGYGKIGKTDFGLMAGCGSVRLLQYVKKRVVTTKSSSFNHVLALITEEVSALMDDPDFKPWMMERTLEETAWMCTYVSRLKDGSPELYLAGYRISNPDEIEKAFANQAIIIHPHASDPETTAVLLERVNSEAKSLRELSDFDEHLRFHCNLIREVVWLLAEIDDTVSRTFQIGFFAVDGRTGISPICQEDLTLRID
jgi:hypothetical protein